MTLAQFFAMERAPNRIVIPSRERMTVAHFNIRLGAGVRSEAQLPAFLAAARGRTKKRRSR